NQVAAESALAERLSHLHVNVAVRNVVVEQNAACGGDFAIHFDHPFADRFHHVWEDTSLVVLGSSPERPASGCKSGRERVVKKNRFALDLAGTVEKHEGKENIVGALMVLA